MKYLDLIYRERKNRHSKEKDKKRFKGGRLLPKMFESFFDYISI